MQAAALKPLHFKKNFAFHDRFCVSRQPLLSIALTRGLVLLHSEKADCWLAFQWVVYNAAAF
jgi:hypothetical protein